MQGIDCTKNPRWITPVLQNLYSSIRSIPLYSPHQILPFLASILLIFLHSSLVLSYCCLVVEILCCCTLLNTRKSYIWSFELNHKESYSPSDQMVCKCDLVPFLESAIQISRLYNRNSFQICYLWSLFYGIPNRIDTANIVCFFLKDLMLYTPVSLVVSNWLWIPGQLKSMQS